jgi:hypothetical protein
MCLGSRNQAPGMNRLKKEEFSPRMSRMKRDGFTPIQKPPTHVPLILSQKVHLGGLDP